jgi:hypothetical protein
MTPIGHCYEPIRVTHQLGTTGYVIQQAQAAAMRRKAAGVAPQPMSWAVAG